MAVHIEGAARLVAVLATGEVVPDTCKAELAAMVQRDARQAASAHPGFSFAHSGPIALFALTEGRHVGVDVEVLRPFTGVLAIAGSLFARPAREELASLSESQRPAAFLAWWTRTEAYLKARGGGWRGAVGLELDTVPVGPRPVRGADDAMPGRDWAVNDLPLPGHAAAVAAEGTEWTIHWYRWSGGE